MFKARSLRLGYLGEFSEESFSSVTRCEANTPLLLENSLLKFSSLNPVANLFRPLTGQRVKTKVTTFQKPYKF